MYMIVFSFIASESSVCTLKYLSCLKFVYGCHSLQHPVTIIDVYFSNKFTDWGLRWPEILGHDPGLISGKQSAEKQNL